MSRARWLLLGALLTVPIAVGLVLAGVVPLSAALYAGLFGGMIVMHLFGHGHGGHRRAGHATASNPRHLSQPSSGSQPMQPPSLAWLTQPTTDEPTASEMNEDDQHSSHACH